MSPSYAIVESGGKQYRVEKGTTLLVDRLPGGEGSKVALPAVMFRGDDQVVLDRGQLEKVKVEAVVTGHERGKKVRILKFKPKRGYKRRLGHRSDLTRLEVKDIKLLSRKPAAKAGEGKPATKAEQRAGAAQAGQKKAASGKAATKKPAAKAGRKKPAAAKARGGKDGS